jgi:hypothetical protein
MSSQTTRYSYYLLRGVTSVLETLGSHPTATYIVHTCLQEFKGDFMDDWESRRLGQLFTVNFTRLEYRLLEGLQDEQKTTQTPRVIALRRDFVNAHCLQYLVAPNLALHRNFLALRVELYIRIRNTESSWKKDELVNDMMGRPPCDDNRLIYHNRDVEMLSGESGYIGQSLTCPVVAAREENSLTPCKSHWSIKLQCYKLKSSLSTEIPIPAMHGASH